ncbi:uncharacterized protein LOC111340987 [Stylophora pistillata]|uniref:uncharacterized protein LOC111340987 n=1 Tax=Stylophora pistillata TaxID=50429 RepID=UPI000C03B6F2|nr:uncharacterized protein LOC111340987 [Stylophora pistillata]
MEVSRAKFFMVVFLSSIDVIIPGSVLISRLISQPKDQQTWKKVNDSFVVPSSACYQGRIGTGSNYCNESCTKDDSKEQYSCDCPWKSATVTYVNNTWICLENKMVRKKLGCAINNLFHHEREWHGLYTLSTQPSWGRKTTLYNEEASCVLNTSSSWVIGCHGEKTPVDNLTNRTKKIFFLGWRNKSNAYYIKVVDPIAIFRGRIINLGVSCSQPPADIKEGCLLFKLEGNITCPVKYSMGSTLSPATSSLELTSPSATKVTEEKIDPTQSKVTNETIYPTQISSRATPGKKKKSNDVDSSSINVGIIAGVIVAVIILSLLITALIIYRRRRSRNASYTITDGQVGNENTTTCNSRTNQAFQLEERSRYVLNDSCYR